MPQTPDASSASSVPLVVDLDGTLIKTDMLWEHLVRLLRKNPFAMFAVLSWWLRGRAFLKQQLVRRVTVDASTLPFHEPFLAWLKEQKASGRKLILATASDLQMATPVAERAGIFDEVLASDGRTNLRSRNKLKALTEKFGDRGFDYAGNSTADIAVWDGCRQAVVVNASAGLARRAGRHVAVAKIFEPSAGFLPAIVRCLRPHQWVKNLIIFAPIVAAHKLNDTALLVRDLEAFVLFCLGASGVYIMNDLLDLDADRRHTSKRNRPLASGTLPIQAGLFLAPILLAAALGGAFWLPTPFPAVMAGYMILTIAYSLRIKRVVLLDVFFLAGLYTIRLIGGHAATGIVYSAWLLMFSMFIFLSLALVKRYVELAEKKEDDAPIAGRGYEAGDLEIVASLGTGSGFLAALVLALYVNSEQVTTLYAHPNLLLLVCPLLLYWVSRVWLLAHRRLLHDDPVLFAVKDPTSYVIGILALAVLWLAAAH
ncbi:MAG TPA: UbiA family prenyltransferase [Desulfuromonadaceae bacterium]|nr:UbiA family prenyltransferase [Desulfuromonadaceae bacterium]